MHSGPKYIEKYQMHQIGIYTYIDNAILLGLPTPYFCMVHFTNLYIKIPIWYQHDGVFDANRIEK